MVIFGSMTQQSDNKATQASTDFQQHYNLVSSLKLPPAQTVLQAVNFFDIGHEKCAVDLGCGAGADTLYLLNEGWSVYSVDKELYALEELKLRWPSPALTISQQIFENLQIPQANLINASFALPFCLPEHFNHCWSQIQDSLSLRGIFCGHFFGERDSWSTRNDMTFHSKSALLELLKDFEIKWQLETEKDGRTLGGEHKHWHVHHIVACKL